MILNVGTANGETKSNPLFKPQGSQWPILSYLIEEVQVTNGTQTDYQLPRSVSQSAREQRAKRMVDKQNTYLPHSWLTSSRALLEPPRPRSDPSKLGIEAKIGKWRSRVYRLC
jgi:hypothetical protein